MPLTVAIVGTGPTGLYAFKALTADTAPPLTIWLFERGQEAGVGMPYSDETASKAMLANIASIEIPPVTRSYLDWMRAQPPALLQAAFRVDMAEIDERSFTPRLMLGRYYRDEFMAVVRLARARGHEIEIREGCEVEDIALEGEGLRITTDAGPVEALFDRVLLATGHVFPDDDEATRRYFPSPWSGLLDADIPACRVGIMGTSLSAIDAAMAVACQHGRFVRAGDGLAFEGAPEGLAITMMSRTGILPEADFYCPIPYEPLQVLTDARLEALRADGASLDELFDLVREELTAADPDYAAEVGLADATADTVAAAYFAGRRAHDPFAWARENLAEVERNKAERITVAWRYAILRMHEPVETLVEDFSDADRKRFDGGLKTVFVDNYAAVPPESIRRLLALRDAGVLSVRNIGSDYDLKVEARRTVITAGDAKHVFDVFIDARGQKPLGAEDLPFPSLRAALLAEGGGLIEVDEDYALAGDGPYAGRVLLGSIPYLMHDRPFVQGITAAEEIGIDMARSVRRDASERLRLRRRRRVAA